MLIFSGSPEKCRTCTRIPNVLSTITYSPPEKWLDDEDLLSSSACVYTFFFVATRMQTLAEIVKHSLQ